MENFSKEQVIEQASKTGLVKALGIEITSVEPQEIRGTMPVDHRTTQPFGILHGGASVAFAETLCSVGAWFNLKSAYKALVGLEINANHISSIDSGLVHGLATPVHLGNKTQVWETRIENPEGGLVCMSRMTLIALEKSLDGQA